MESGQVDQLIAEGQAAFPELAIAGDQLRALVKQRLEQAGPGALAADEVYLACACALHDPVALKLFEKRYFAVIPQVLSRMSLARDQIDEVAQTLRVRLFVGEANELPRVVGYAGDGQLGGLVRVAALRAGLNLLRDTGKLDRDDDGFEDISDRSDSPEHSQLKAEHRAAFKAAFEEAIGTLESRDRSLLQLSIVKGQGIDRIAAIYAVHRATAARWLQSARENLTRAVHKRLGERLKIPPAELGDLLPLVESKLELSLDRLLRSRVTLG